MGKGKGAEHGSTASTRRDALGDARSPAEPRPDGRPRPPPPVQGPESGRSAGPEAPTGRARAVPVGTRGRSRAPLRRVHRGNRRLYRRGDGAAAVALPRRRVSMRYSSPIYCLSPATQCVPRSVGPSPPPPAPGPCRAGPTAPPAPPPFPPPHGAAPRFAPCAPPQPRRLRGSSRSWLAPLPASAPAQTPVSAPEYFTVGEQEGGETA